MILRQEDGLFYKPNGSAAGSQDLERHVSNILAGLYSLGGKPDVALVEGSSTSTTCSTATLRRGP